MDAIAARAGLSSRVTADVLARLTHAGIVKVQERPGTTPVRRLRRCRVCECTDDDCRQCIARTGRPCCWVEEDLCSACAEEAAGAERKEQHGRSGTDRRRTSAAR